MGPRIEDIDFHPRIPIVRLVLAALAFGVLSWAFVNEKWNAFTIAGRLESLDVTESIGIGLLLLVSFCFIVSFLLLQFRLKFSEEGIHRLTLFGPRFIPWASVKTARVGTFKGYIMLELWVSRRRWVYVPLLEYRSSARLLEEITRRLPVKVQVSQKQLELLSDGG